jgi:hypothetical protein
MNRIARVLLDNSADLLAGGFDKRDRDLEAVSDFFARMDSGAEEQVAYFPFNPDNPIYKRLKLRPRVVSGYVNSAASGDAVLIGAGAELVNEKGENCMNVSAEFLFGDDGRADIYLPIVTNVCVKPENRGRHIAAHYVNTLQNFLVYGKNPGNLRLRTNGDGNYYWAKWFDFDYTEKGAREYLPLYRAKFAAAFDGTPARKDIRRAVKVLRHPVEFRTIRLNLGAAEKEMEKLAMRNSLEWNGRCGLEEMIEGGVVRRRGTEILAEQGVRFDHPVDFQKIVARRLRARRR